MCLADSIELDAELKACKHSPWQGLCQASPLSPSSGSSANQHRLSHAGSASEATSFCVPCLWQGHQTPRQPGSNSSAATADSGGGDDSEQRRVRRQHAAAGETLSPLETSVARSAVVAVVAGDHVHAQTVAAAHCVLVSGRPLDEHRCPTLDVSIEDALSGHLLSTSCCITAGVSQPPRDGNPSSSLVTGVGHASVTSAQRPWLATVCHYDPSPVLEVRPLFA